MLYVYVPYMFCFFFTAAEYNYVTRINLHFIFFGEHVYKSTVQRKTNNTLPITCRREAKQQLLQHMNLNNGERT